MTERRKNQSEEWTSLCLSVKHQPCQVPTLSMHDHNHLNTNHANLAPPGHHLHITTSTPHSPLSGNDRRDLQTLLRTPAREPRPLILNQISPSDHSLLPATAAPQPYLLIQQTSFCVTTFSPSGLVIHMGHPSLTAMS